jgi:SAM-dependent methyltransferase
MKTLEIDYLSRYIVRAPLGLALERVQECWILSRKSFARPILDIGCGDGIFAEVFFPDKLEYGLDPNKKEIERARITGRYLELFNSPGNKVPLDDSSVGTIICNSVLEHIKDIDGVLREAHRVLKPEGRFYLTIPTDKFDRNSIGSTLLELLGLHNLAAKYRRMFNKFWCHYNFHDYSGWKDVFNRNGFEIADSQMYCSKKQCLIDNALVPFALPSFFARKYIGRWFWFPLLRRMSMFLLLPVARLLVSANISKSGDGAGLIFFELKR